MLYVYTGTDIQKARTQARALRAALAKKRPDAEHFFIGSDDMSYAALDGVLYGKGLFESKHVVTLDSVLEHPDGADIFEKRISDIGATEHLFIFIAEKIPAALARACKKHAHTFETFDAPKKADDMQARFALPDAFGKRDRKGMWVAYQRAVISGAEPEALHGLLFWQVKSMLLAADAESPEAAGMKTFPYKKAKQFAHNYTSEELHARLQTLVQMYTDARRGKYELSTALERFALTL